MPKLKKYTQDFKKKLVTEILENDILISQISKREGISSKLIKQWAKEFITRENIKKDSEVTELKKRINELEITLADYLLESHLSKKNILLVTSAVVIVILLLSLFSQDLFFGNRYTDSQSASYACDEMNINIPVKKKKTKKEKSEYSLETKKIISITTKEGQKLIGKIIKITTDKIFLYNEITQKKFTIFKKDIKLDGIEIIGNKE
jgi:transposase-like protein